MGQSSLDKFPAHATLLEKFSANWSTSGIAPVGFRRPFDLEDRTSLSQHLLQDEICDMLDGKASVLPFFGKHQVHWVLTAPDERQLLIGIQNLRSWILPSFGWEEHPSIVSVGDQATDLGKLILAVSPVGYFRWSSTVSGIGTVLQKLSDLRKLNAVKPRVTYERVPSLIELRQQFRVALAIGDRTIADAALQSIDRFELDSAVNTSFMRIRAWGVFGDFKSILRDPRLPELLQMRMPRSVRVAVVQAFYKEYLEPCAQTSDWGPVQQIYHDKVHPEIGALVGISDPDDGVEVQRTMGCLAVYGHDPVLMSLLLRHGSDSDLKAILAPLQISFATAEVLQQYFELAWRREDWVGIQYAGTRLLNEEHAISSDFRGSVIHVLRRSLEYASNESVQRTLKELAVPVPTRPAVPQSWEEFAEAVTTKDFDKVYAFLAADERPVLALGSLSELQSVQLLVEEVLTDPALVGYHGVDLADLAISTLVEESVRSARFPDARLEQVYLCLFQFWSDHRFSSGRRESENVFLFLASGLLELQTIYAELVSNAVLHWWRSRPNRSRLSFMLESFDLLTQAAANPENCSALWSEVAAVVKICLPDLTRGEVRLWSTIGQRIGYSSGTIDAALGLTTLPKARELEDPIRSANLRKIAIVSLNKSAAEQAGQIIGERTEANIVLVNEKVAGGTTEGAKNADVILYVWGATTHAVYRAFDTVRDKIEYVSGKGATSIVLALERWVAKGL